MIRLLAFLGAFATQAIFLTLKLTGAIGWSWWWVASPAWIYCGFLGLCGIVLALLGVALVGAIICK